MTDFTELTSLPGTDRERSWLERRLPLLSEYERSAPEEAGMTMHYLSRIEQSINDNGFTTRRATEQDLKRMLGVYFEQNVTTEKFEDYDGDRWVIVGE